METSDRNIYHIVLACIGLVTIAGFLLHKYEIKKRTETQSKMSTSTLETQTEQETNTQIREYLETRPVLDKEYVSQIKNSSDNLNILEEEDFNIYGYTNYDDISQNSIYKIRINSSVSPYIFYISPQTEHALGFVSIFEDGNELIHLNTITQDPNTFLADQLHKFFTAQDINFDGNLDIGFPIGGGSKWISYQFWLFDPEQKIFIDTPFTDEFRQLTFNELKLDKNKKQIITTSLYGDMSTYQVDNNHISIAIERHQEPLYDVQTQIVTGCLITTKIYENTDPLFPKILTEKINTECPGYPRYEL